MATLIYNCTAVLMDEGGTILPGAFVAVEETKISFVGTERPAGQFSEEIDGKGHVLMPGLVNAHTHVPMTLLRGYGGGTDLQTWLTQFIFPAEDKLDARAVRAGVKLALAEMIASGTTTIADMYMFCDEICQEVVQAGLSANICRGLTLFSDDFSPEVHAGFLDMQALHKTWHGYGEGQILVDACIHGEYTSKPQLWGATADFAANHNLGMHVHVSETRAEHEACKARHGKTPIAVLNDFGIWDTRAIAAHCVWTEEADWEIMRGKGVSVIHNPVSNLKLGSGIAPIPRMKKAGVRIGLGTDGASSNNNLDLFEEMKFASILHNGANCDPLALLPLDVLRMATAEGAAALGRKTGQIAVGYTADLILVDFTKPHLMPCHSAADNLVYSARGSDVSMNMARGKVIYKDGVFFTLDLEAARAEAISYAVPLLFG